jgi:hypothetical protein
LDAKKHARCPLLRAIARKIRIGSVGEPERRAIPLHPNHLRDAIARCSGPNLRAQAKKEHILRVAAPNEDARQPCDIGGNTEPVVSIMGDKEVTRQSGAGEPLAHKKTLNLCNRLLQPNLWE